MAKCKRHHIRFNQINIIPFVDVMLVLLAMVLTTASFDKQNSISVELPDSSVSNKKDLQKEINLYVKSNGDIYFEKEKVNQEQLHLKLSAISKEQSVVIKSDKNSKFQDFVSIMSLLEKLGHKKLYIITKQ